MLVDLLFWMIAGLLISPFYRSFLIPVKHRGKRLAAGNRGSRFYSYYHDKNTYESIEEFGQAEKKLTMKAIKFSCAITFIAFLAGQL